MSDPITTVLHTDPACPWAYSEIPALTVIQWRYGAQLDWRLVTIGLTESAQQYIDRGYTTARQARGYLGFRRFGMPFAPQPKLRISATARACRAIVASRLLEPGRRVGGSAGVCSSIAVQLAAGTRRRRSPGAGGVGRDRP